MTQAQIAGILNCSEKAVETRLYRAREFFENYIVGVRKMTEIKRATAAASKTWKHVEFPTSS